MLFRRPLHAGPDCRMQETIMAFKMSTKKTVKIFFAQYCNLSESEGGSDTEERVSHRKRASCHAKTSERRTPAIIQCWETRDKEAKAKGVAPP